MAEDFVPGNSAFLPEPRPDASPAQRAFAEEAAAAGVQFAARQAPKAGSAPSFAPQSAPSPVSGQVPQRPSTGAAPQVQAQRPAAQAPATQATAASAGTAAAAASPRRLGMGGDNEAGFDLAGALRAMLAAGASDLHISAGSPPMIRVDGGLVAVEGFEKLTPDSIQRSIYSVITQKQRETFEEHLELDMSYSLIGEARFRVNIYKQRNAIGAAFRVIPYEIKPLEALGVPATVGHFAGMPRGLVLVTGPTGSGKSTTLASLIDLINRNRADHIMTVEDPIEFLHRHKTSLINQREVGTDTKSFANALKHVLRQDPDVILIGEMRDLETIQVALTAAETGHLVFGTLHTQDTAQTISRIIDVFPPEQQAQVQTQLGSALQGVVCQNLIKRNDGPGRAVATEVMVATPAIRNLIREGKTHQIYSMLQAGSRQGMHTMDQHLAELVKSGRISYEAGAEACHHYEDFNRLCGRQMPGQMQGQM
ncbi:type IV pilus twitching motility protein PilT [Demequina sp. NBRC 110051]|uniref:type IV pilus twitching motility protein PilT n=1 Tax=Demequina sp. NBRC 110051 TaxID=1570340 RepID=UPI000A00EF6A|nr:type IV pilus twitching motility protein PilT [Demequina sp. NBRC 110051]